ncbi:hypothetical protein ZOSMA_333G00040 [Zostera marina]|uniref:DUF4283 domain-containing protein n=1 Tax=Zostera marina TaxID=29655 RepID=A0A0K9P810_ZOSMR|nr:hypothetical protein ZOSMA_333G00040 [Zostera marina]
MIRRESLEKICEQAYDWIPQWAYVKGLKPEMYAKSVVDSILSVLGPPLMAEYTNTSRHPHCLRVAFQADTTSNYISTIPMIINEGRGKESITTLKVAYDIIPSRCTRCRKFGYSSAQCPMENIPLSEKINSANIPQITGKHILEKAEEEAPMTPREIILIEAAHSAQNKVGYVEGLVKSWPPQTKNQATSPMIPLHNSRGNLQRIYKSSHQRNHMLEKKQKYYRKRWHFLPPKKIRKRQIYNLQQIPRYTTDGPCYLTEKMSTFTRTSAHTQTSTMEKVTSPRSTAGRM